MSSPIGSLLPRRRAGGPALPTLFLALTFTLLLLPMAAGAETCTRQQDGSTVCCDNSGVCYKK